MKDKTKLAEKLVELRNSRGLTQKQVAEAIGVEEYNYRKYETTTLPRADVYIRIADFYDVTTDYLLGRTNKKFGEEKKIIATYSEKDSNKSFVLHQPKAEIKLGENNLGKLSDFEILIIKKLRKISYEDRNDVVQYLSNKKDI